MTITATLVRELRERTGAGMMDCKRALQETGGDIEAAIEAMRKSGIAKAAGKAGRIAAEGVITIKTDETGKQAMLLEVNCETDFVAKDESFLGFVGQLATTIVADAPADLDALSAMPLADGAGKTVEEARQELVARLGENISIRRFTLVNANSGVLGSYIHGSRIGVVTELNTDNTGLAKDLSMHIAASRPLYITEQDVPQTVLDKERDILTAQAQTPDKSDDIIKKMVEGRLGKFLKEIALLGQPFVKEPDINVAKLLQDNAAEVLSFVRYEVGEGIEKKADNFAEEVMQQAGMS
ncbi:MAG: translation elongation factor Ts [Gammaproteobacteria bacterium]